MYAIEVAEDAQAELGDLRAFERVRIVAAIRAQLSHEPVRPARNRKLLRGLQPPWQHLEPVWELRVGEYRVFYDVHEALKLVMVRAVRRKPPHTTTEEIL